MGFMPDEDAEQLSAYLSDFFEKQAPLSRAREWAETESGYDAALWRRCATELGLQGLAVSAEFGGADAGLVNLGVAFEQLGRALVCAPFLSTIGLAATALSQLSGSAVAAELLSRIAAGELVATLAWAGPRPSTSQLRVEAGTLDGVADIVIDGDVAEAILVAARSAEHSCGLFLVRPDAPGLIREPLVSLDSTRRLARLSFHDVPVEVLATDAEALLERTMDVATLLLAAEQLGGAQWVLDSAVDYARTRVQFGRRIGSFQAIKHRCADLLVDVELARSVVYHALDSAQRDPSTLPFEAALARSVVSEAFLTGAAASLQIHGGIGFTWEHSAHLYLKRAKSSALIFGDPIHHRRRLAEHLELTGAQAATDAAVTHTAATGTAVTGTAATDTAVTDSAVMALIDRLLAAHPIDSTPDREVRGARFDAGLAFVQFAQGHGGLELDPAVQAEVDEAFTRAGSPEWHARNVIGLGMAAPTIHAHGTEEQKRRLLRPLFVGDEIWCQLFSEPGAGSDLAALSTRAVAREDGWVISGQKVWTTLAHVARWGLLLARTDPDVPKHKGLTYFLLDMTSPGVEVRPLRQLTGEAEFNEVYFDDVFVPHELVLGEVGDGWRVAMTTLMNERQSLGGRLVERGEGPIGQLVEAYRGAVAAERTDPGDLDRVMRLWTRAEAVRLTNVRASDAAQRGTPGPQGSIAKLQMAEMNKAIYDLAMEFAGTDALLFSSYAETRPDFAAVHGGSGDLRYDYLRSLANSIEGGTSEILRNILGERVLGLPAEPRVDKDIPWSKVLKS